MKITRRFLFAAVAAVAMVPHWAAAGQTNVEVSTDQYFYIGPSLPNAAYYPNDSSENAITWNSIFMKTDTGTPNARKLKAGEVLVLARRNSRREQNVKTLAANIGYTGSGTLHADTVLFGSVGGKASGGERLVEVGNLPGTFFFAWKIFPQPDWEVGVIRNTGTTDSLVSVLWGTQCKPNSANLNQKRIPTLTGWGLVILVTLLSLTAVWVIRKRKAGLVT